MKKIFINKRAVQGKTILLDAQESNHLINALRYQAGDSVLVSDQQQTEYETVIEKVTDGRALLKITSAKPIEKTGLTIRLVQGLCKGDKMDWVVQKAAEFGVSEIVPLETMRTIVRLDADKAKKKVDRWQKIALAAAKQSGAPAVMTVSGVKKISEMAAEENGNDLRLLFWEEALPGSLKEVLKEHQPESITIFIGPEGGFDSTEVRLLEESGVKTVSLGQQILRTETAAVAATVCVMYHYDRLG